MTNGEIRRMRKKASQRRAQRLGLNRGEARALVFRTMSPAGVAASRGVLALVAERKQEGAAA